MKNFVMTTTLGPVKRIKLYTESNRMEISVIPAEYITSNEVEEYEDDEPEDSDNGTIYLGGTN